MTKAVDSGMPKLRIEEAAARRQARVDRGEEVIVGVNKYRWPTIPTTSTCSTSTTPKVREQQIARLEQVRATRDAAACDGGPRGACATGAAGDGNLLALCIDAARARATVGEMSDAMEAVFGRHKAEIRSISGVYGCGLRGRRGLRGHRRRGRGLRRGRGAPPAHPHGQDGPGRPRPRRQGRRHRLRRPRLRRRLRPAVRDARAEVARAAVENDVHVVGVSSQAAGHKTLVPQLIERAAPRPAPTTSSWCAAA